MTYERYDLGDLSYDGSAFEMYDNTQKRHLTSVEVVDMLNRLEAAEQRANEAVKALEVAVAPVDVGGGKYQAVGQLLAEIGDLKRLLDQAGTVLHRHVTHGLTRNNAGRMRDEIFRITRKDTEENDA